MRKQYHILNGDALKRQFPKKVNGELIVARECLVDGNVEGKNIEELFQTRAQFISKHYGGSEKDYYEKTVPEFQKILKIEDNSDVFLWFEDDLFCQVNFWFVVHLLNNQNLNNNYFLVRPEADIQYGFGGLSESELILAYKNRIHLTNIETIASLWKYYQNDNLNKLIKTGEALKNEYPFILTAVKAHIDRIPKNGNAGRPTETLKSIIKELNTKDFGTVFREFNKREGIYGFGDLQVKRIFDEIISN